MTESKDLHKKLWVNSLSEFPGWYKKNKGLEDDDSVINKEENNA